jgi:glucan 1,3-beta-glucosidase
MVTIVGRRFSSPRATLGCSEVSTPPKTPSGSCRCVARSRSPRICTASPRLAPSAAVSDACRAVASPVTEPKQDTGTLPFWLCEAISNAIWTNAREQAKAGPRESTGDVRSVAQVSRKSFFDLSQLSQSQSQDTERVLTEEEKQSLIHLANTLHEANMCFAEHVKSSLADGSLTLANSSKSEEIILTRIHSMTLHASEYWQNIPKDLGRAASSLTRFLEHQRRLYWNRPAWRGVNLGGWLLLEPGPSHQLFRQYADGASCEWQLLQRMHQDLGAEKSAEVIKDHRKSFLQESDIRQIRELGFNAVRIPFGYWIVTGPAADDVYVGPGLEFIDRALEWCQAYGLQALLDLHGAPGGESGEKPCGREWKDWSWANWRFEESVQALRIIARRYRGHPAVSGISVCNEPSETVPADVLCNFYEKAVLAIREEGMLPDAVSILLPVYRSERLDEIWQLWNHQYDGFIRFANVAFDLHLYHCFGSWWHRQGFASHLRMTKRHRKILRRVPAVVGEWSLALPLQSLAEGDAEQEDQAYRMFAEAQLDAYSQASHGWFFWNWCDSPHMHPGWDFRTCNDRRWLSKEQITSWTRGPSRF